MRVLSLATTHPRYAGDGEPSYVAALNRELSALGHEVTAILPHAVTATRRETVDGVSIRRFRYFRPERLQRLCYDGGILPNLRRSWLARLNLPFFLAAQATAVGRAMRGRRFDLVHAHWLLPSGFMAALLRPLGNGPPLVVTAHGSDVFSTSRLFVSCNRFVLQRAALCTVNSTRSRERVNEIRRGTRVEVVPMGVDTSRFHPERASADARRALGDGHPQLLFVGRFSASKGLDHLVRALPEIVAEVPGARLALVGFGPEEAAIRRAAEKNGVTAFITFLGRVSRDDLPPLMAAADLLVLPSVRIEGLGVVLLEALASGTAVVGSDVGGIPDVIRPGETGLLCRQADPGDLAATCLEMLTDDELRRRTATAGRRLVESRYSWSGLARRFDELFRATIGR